MSEVFSKLAEKFKEEEEQPTTIPLEFPTGDLIPTEPVAQPLSAQTAFQAQILVLETTRSADNLELKAEIEEGKESGEEGNSRGKDGTRGEKEEGTPKSVGKESIGKALQVVNVEEGESGDDRETLSERTVSRSSRTQRGLDREELRSMREEAAILAAAKREAVESKRKGKGVATPSKSRKSRPA